MQGTTKETATAVVTGMNLLQAMALVDLSVARDMKYVPVSVTDRLAGVMNEDMQRLDCIRYDLHTEATSVQENAKNIRNEHRNAHLQGEVSPEVCDANAKEVAMLREKFEELTRQHSHVADAFWAMLKLQFPPLEGEEMVAIREGNRVVWAEDDSKASPLSEIEDILAELGMSAQIIRL